jgi:ABC-type branched-subunit amino acid transport system substrate-binding protein
MLKLGVYSASEPPAVKNYVHAMEAFGPITTPLITTSYQYDSVMVVAQAAKQANSIATPALVKALDHLKQPAHPLWVTLDKYVFSSSNHAPAASPSNWIVTPVTTLTNGQYGGPSS